MGSGVSGCFGTRAHGCVEQYAHILRSYLQNGLPQSFGELVGLEDELEVRKVGHSPEQCRVRPRLEENGHVDPVHRRSIHLHALEAQLLQCVQIPSVPSEHFVHPGGAQMSGEPHGFGVRLLNGSQAAYPFLRRVPGRALEVWTTQDAPFHPRVGSGYGHEQARVNGLVGAAKANDGEPHFDVAMQDRAPPMNRPFRPQGKTMDGGAEGHESERVLLCSQCLVPLMRGSQILNDPLPYSQLVYRYQLEMALLATRSTFPCYQLSSPNGTRADIVMVSWDSVSDKLQIDDEATDETQHAAAGDRWFQGFAGQRVRCEHCKTHLGWRFQPTVATQSAVYRGIFPPGLEPAAFPMAGLILTKMKPRDARMSLRETSGGGDANSGQDDGNPLNDRLRMEITRDDARAELGDDDSVSIVGTLLVHQLQSAMMAAPAGEEVESPNSRKSRQAMDAVRRHTISLAERFADHDEG